MHYPPIKQPRRSEQRSIKQSLVKQSLVKQSLAWLLMLFLVACGRELANQDADTLAFTMTPMAEQQVAFAVIAPQANYRWDFGDGNGAEGAEVQHRYAQAGRYLVTLSQYREARIVAQQQQWLELLPNSASGYGRVQGFVVNRKAGQPVVGSEVQVVGSTLRTLTDARGFYSLDVPSGEVSLRFSQAGYAQSLVQGLRVRAGEVSYYDTVQLEAFIPWLPAQAPTVDVQLEDEGVLEPGSELRLRIEAESSDPANKRIYGLVTVSWEQARGLSSLWDDLEAGERLERFQGSADLRISTAGLAGESRLHVVVHDQSLNRTEVLRYVSVARRSHGSSPLAPQDLQGLAVTFGDIAYSSVTMRRSALSRAPALATAAGAISADRAFEAAFNRLLGLPLDIPRAIPRTSDWDISGKALLDDAMLDNVALDNVAPDIARHVPFSRQYLAATEHGYANSLDRQSDTARDRAEAITWVDLFFHYPAGVALPEAFEVYRQLEGETGFRRLVRLPAEALRYEPEEDILVDVARHTFGAAQYFRYRDASPGLATGLEARYYVEAVNGDARARSSMFHTRALEPMQVELLNPASGERLTSVAPTYRMRLHNRNRLLHTGILVLDLVQADAAPTMLGLLFVPIDDPNIIFVDVQHLEFALPLQPYHAYEWQAIAMTSDGELDAEGEARNIRAVAIAADSFSNLGIDYGFPHGVRSGGRHVFLTGDGSY